MGMMLGPVPPWGTMMDLRSGLFMAHLARCCSGEYFHRQALLTAAAAFLTPPHVTVPPPLVGGSWRGKRVVASLQQGGRRWVAPREGFPRDATQAGEADPLVAHDQPELEGPYRASRARQGVRRVCRLGSAPALLEARGPDLLVDEGVKAVPQAPLGRLGIIVAPATDQPCQGRPSGHCISEGLAGDGVHGLPKALDGFGGHA
jgi:hypothetical protein